MTLPNIFAKSAVFIILVCMTVIFLIPVGMMISGSFKPDNQVLREAGNLLTFFPTELIAVPILARLPIKGIAITTSFAHSRPSSFTGSTPSTKR
jgi:ABC-type glycerol-3-phosphate transport system permease component